MYVVDDNLLRFWPHWFVAVDAGDERCGSTLNAGSKPIPRGKRRWAMIGCILPSKGMRSGLRRHGEAMPRNGRRLLMMINPNERNDLARLDRLSDTHGTVKGRTGHASGFADCTSSAEPSS